MNNAKKDPIMYYSERGVIEQLLHPPLSAFEPQDEILMLLHKWNHLGNKLGESILVDIGIGIGSSIIPFVEQFNLRKILGIDGSDQMIAEMLIATAPMAVKYGLEITPQTADMRTGVIALNNASTDIVIACSLLSYFENVENVFREAQRVLRKGGFFGFNLVLHDEEKNAAHIAENFPVSFYLQKSDVVAELMRKYNFGVCGSVIIGWNASITSVDGWHQVFLLKKQ